MLKLSKSRLGIVLSELKDFEKHDLKLEQYSTPPEIAADLLWKAYMNGDIDGKTILDAACGPGFLGIGALLFGAKKVFFVDKSKNALDILKKNIEFIDGKYESGIKRRIKIIESNISDADKFIYGKIDTVVQNPPFGTKEKHHDKLFLEKAFLLSNIVYSFHKTVTKKFVDAISKDFGFVISHFWRYDFAIKAAHRFHEKKRYIVDVTVFRFEKK
jgi:putative methylase